MSMKIIHLEDLGFLFGLVFRIYFPLVRWLLVYAFVWILI